MNRKDSATGPDGIPYSGWKNGDPMVHQCLYQAYAALLRGHAPPLGFNHGLLASLPTVDVAEGEAKSILEPKQTRTLTLSNTDNKLISIALAIPFQTQAQHSVVSCQRGFIGGRNLLDNVAELESWVVDWACYRGL
eukprot:2638237-Pyramimonas_sp.AAC.1